MNYETKRWEPPMEHPRGSLISLIFITLTVMKNETTQQLQNQGILRWKCTQHSTCAKPKTNVYSKSENYNKSKSVGNATNGQNNEMTTKRDTKKHDINTQGRN